MQASRSRARAPLVFGISGVAILAAPLALSASVTAQLAAGCAALLIATGAAGLAVAALSEAIADRARNHRFARARQLALTPAIDPSLIEPPTFGYRTMRAIPPARPVVVHARLRPARWALAALSAAALSAALLWTAVPSTAGPAVLALALGVASACAIGLLSALLPDVRALSPEGRSRRVVALERRVCELERVAASDFEASPEGCASQENNLRA